MNRSSTNANDQNEASLYIFHKLVFVLTLLLLFTVTTPVYAHKMRISVPPFAPFAFIHKEQVLKTPAVNTSNICAGVSIQIIKKLLKDTQIKFDLINYPYARILHSLVSGKLDAALIFKNNTVANSVDYIGPITQSKVVVLTKPKIIIKQYEQLKTLKKIAVIRNAHYLTKFDHDKSLHKFSVESYAQALKMLKADRVAAVVGSLEGLDYALRQQKMPTSWLAHAFVIGSKSWWLHLSKKSRYQSLKPQLIKNTNHIYETDLNYQLYQQAMKNCKN